MNTRKIGYFTGILDNIDARWQGKTLAQICYLDPAKDSYTPVSADSVALFFAILMVGVGLAFSLFVIETVYGKCREFVQGES